MQQLETKGITDRWIKASWEEYLAAIKNFPENQGKSYYYNGYYRLEMTPIGFEHARDHPKVHLPKRGSCTEHRGEGEATQAF